MTEKFGYVIIESKKEFENLEFFLKSSWKYRISGIGIFYNYDEKELNFPLYLKKIKDVTCGTCAEYSISSKEEMVEGLNDFIKTWG